MRRCGAEDTLSSASETVRLNMSLASEVDRQLSQPLCFHGYRCHAENLFCHEMKPQKDTVVDIPERATEDTAQPCATAPLNHYQFFVSARCGV